MKRATELAVACDTDAALKALAEASEAGGLGGYLAGLERVGILRDSGRRSEAEKALDDYLALPENADTERSDVEASINEFIVHLRDERQQSSGSRVCPGM